MESLIATYASSSDSDTETDPTHSSEPIKSPTPLPPPPLSLLQTPNSLGTLDLSNQPNRVRNFPHTEGNFALHVYIPVSIPLGYRKEPAFFLKRVAALVPELHVVDIDFPLRDLVREEAKFEQALLGREFHVSLGRTVPIRVHQRDSVVSMLKQRLRCDKRYWIDFNKWEVFVNDDGTRTFLSMEVIIGGLAQIVKQIRSVNEVYRLHNLPEFYKDPRPHISIAWAPGDISSSLKGAIEEEHKRHTTNGGSSQKRIFTCAFDGISCKIGNKTYDICKIRKE